MSVRMAPDFVDGVMTSVRDEGGRLIGYSKVMRDATAAHEAEQALRESDAFTRNLVEIVPICIKVLDLAGRTQMMNRASREELEIDDAAAYHDRLWIDLWEGEARTEAARSLRLPGREKRQHSKPPAIPQKGRSTGWMQPLCLYATRQANRFVCWLLHVISPTTETQKA